MFSRSAFDRRGHAAKLCIVLLPLLFAALVGISRIDDYWHHWTDVFTGSIIGWAPHASIKMRENIELHSTSIGIDTV
uniref:Phosphatidic acid phosphatase n=1 Tax=Solanum tuberosum TaxID=4113 RepID=M1AL56_SOLTU